MSTVSPQIRIQKDNSIVRNIETAMEQEALDEDATTSIKKNKTSTFSSSGGGGVLSVRSALTRLENHLVDANEKELPHTRARKPAERLEPTFTRPEPKKKGRAKKATVVVKKVEKKKKVTKKKPAKKKTKAPAKKKKTKAPAKKKTKAPAKKKVAPKKKKDAKKTPTEKKKRALSKNKLVTDTVAPVENKVQSKLPIVQAASPAEESHEQEKENTPAVE
ncbi:unnamed protein product [Bathycoccus prasinos]